nr:MAG TPA: hypothetical protein [Caudoviricetes sp.]DAW00862.1 MAG TPA: hypothetical protein [Caudoviricetes sp.]DAW55425.1 MAG TPA: hypothetical protein [Caudoviricetes sp.]
MNIQLIYVTVYSSRKTQNRNGEKQLWKNY